MSILNARNTDKSFVSLSRVIVGHAGNGKHCIRFAAYASSAGGVVDHMLLLCSRGGVAALAADDCAEGSSDEGAVVVRAEPCAYCERNETRIQQTRRNGVKTRWQLVDVNEEVTSDSGSGRIRVRDPWDNLNSESAKHVKPSDPVLSITVSGRCGWLVGLGTLTPR